MTKNIFLIGLSILILAGCSTPGSSQSYDIVSEITERGSSYQAIQLAQSQAQFPYGVKATAGAIDLDLLVTTSQELSSKRITDIQLAVDVLTEQVAQNDHIFIEQISASQVNGDYPRKESANANIQTLDTSSVKIRLTTAIGQNDNAFIEAVAIYNDFLGSLALPDTIKIRALSMEADLGDLEKYRSQIITDLYQELGAVRSEHSQSVKFEISGLYDPLKKIQLSDTEYYLYLEPVITVIDF